jgi:ubiquinone/menaquinone biosynthesis C-methylase UbiE/transcription elongation factor Elf1
MVHHKVCPLCSSEKTGLQYSCVDHFASGKNFTVFKCSQCGFRFTQDYPDENEIAEYYESDSYISHNDEAEGFSNKLYRAARSLMMHRKKKLIRNITRLKTGTLLDIGSGTGYFAGTMKKSGWQAKGIEINERARKFSISYFGLDVATPDKIASFGSNSFDCITLWHVLEHFYDPITYFSEIYRLLKPGAACIIALPNCSSFDAEHYKQFWAAWDVPRHLWHFNPETFSLFSEKTGFMLEDLRILPLDVFYISQLSEKYRGSSFPFIKGISKAAYFSILSFFKKKRSSSVVYILRKSEG